MPDFVDRSQGTDPSTTPGTAPNPQQPRPKPALTPSQDERWALVAHAGGVVGFLPALLVYFTLGDRGDRTRTESAEALNFQATIAVPAIVLYIVSGFVTGIPGFGWIIGNIFWALAGVLLILSAIFSIIAAVAVWRRGTYRYPLAIRLIGK